MKNDSKYNEILEINELSGFSEEIQIDIIGQLFDFSYDKKNIKGIEHAFSLIKQIDFNSLSEINKTTLDYDISNGWNYLRVLKYSKTKEDWSFQSEELSKEIYHLRKTITSKGFNELSKERQCQIYTNIGNTFSYIGRFVESQEYWNKAISIIPKFSMAIGNKALGLFHYGKKLFDDIHTSLFFVFSYHNAKFALNSKKYLQGNAEIGLIELIRFLESIIIDKKYLNEIPNLNSYKSEENEDLSNYRKWCLENILFINPLNDLGNFNIANHDCLNLPTLVTELKKPPIYFSLFNQIKQEFGTARFSFFNSLKSPNPHFSDKDIVIIDALDTAQYSFYLEQLKISFRLSYSILDKIAYLLNDYLGLGIKNHLISFKTLWFENSKDKTLKDIFKNSTNWALRGLYWLSKDLYEKDDDFESVIEPEAKEIAKIRNHIEHKAFKIVSDINYFPNIFEENDINYVISRSNLKSKTLKLLKLTRASIIYLAIALNDEEAKKDYSKIKLPSITLTDIPYFMKT